jgi:hypothetical protein
MFFEKLSSEISSERGKEVIFYDVEKYLGFTHTHTYTQHTAAQSSTLFFAAGWSTPKNVEPTKNS